VNPGDRLGVIFDVDGVLVDSYDAHKQSWRRLARETGVYFTDRDFDDSFGMTSREIIRRYWPESDHGAERVEELDSKKESWYREIIRDDFPVMGGAADLIDALRNENFTIGAGSSGPPENVHLALERLGRSDAFRGVVTGRDVDRGKPEPDVFLLCAERMGVDPARCAVIEDAPAGVTAATRAGMRSVALLSTGRDRADFAGVEPDKIVKNLQILSPSILAGIILK